jgi:hypothetical protein
MTIARNNCQLPATGYELPATGPSSRASLILGILAKTHRMMGQKCSQNDAKPAKNAFKSPLLTTLLSKNSNLFRMSRLTKNEFFGGGD